MYTLDVADTSFLIGKLRAEKSTRRSQGKKELIMREVLTE